MVSTPSITPAHASFFPTYAIDQSVAGLGAGIISTLCMHPLDLIKVKFQVATGPLPAALSGTKTSTIAIGDVKGTGREAVRGVGIGKEMWTSLTDIAKRDGLKGLYRGLTPNLVGNASSWGLYFLWYVYVPFPDRMR